MSVWIIAKFKKTLFCLAFFLDVSSFSVSKAVHKGEFDHWWSALHLPGCVLCIHVWVNRRGDLQDVHGAPSNTRQSSIVSATNLDTFWLLEGLQDLLFQQIHSQYTPKITSCYEISADHIYSQQHLKHYFFPTYPNTITDYEIISSSEMSFSMIGWIH